MPAALQPGASSGRARISSTPSETPLAIARRIAGLRQVDVAERAGVSRSTVAVAEAGARPGPDARGEPGAALGVAERDLWPERS